MLLYIKKLPAMSSSCIFQIWIKDQYNVTISLCVCVSVCAGVCLNSISLSCFLYTCLNDYNIELKNILWYYSRFHHIMYEFALNVFVLVFPCPCGCPSSTTHHILAEWLFQIPSIFILSTQQSTQILNMPRLPK